MPLSSLRILRKINYYTNDYFTNKFLIYQIKLKRTNCFWEDNVNTNSWIFTLTIKMMILLFSLQTIFAHIFRRFINYYPINQKSIFFLFDESSQNTGLTYLRIAHVIHSGCILVSLDLFYRYLFSNITGIIIEVLVCFQIKNFFYFFFFPSLFLLNPCFVFQMILETGESLILSPIY